MGFLANIGNKKNKKIDPGRILTLREAMKYANDSRYEEYEFPPVDPENPLAGYKAVERVKLQTHIKEIKTSRRNPEFEAYVTGNGKYKNIEVKNTITPKYNNWQNAKRYKEEDWR